MKYWHETLAVAQRILTELLRRKRSLMFWSVFPVIILLLNGLITAERAKLSLPTAFELAAPATLVGAGFFFSCLGGTVATIVAEREQHTLKRLFLSPLSGISYFLGIFLAHSAIALAQTLLVVILVYFLGAQWRGSVAIALMILLLSVLSYVGVGFILGTQLARRTEDVNAIVATFGVPLLILGGAFFPSFIFPKVLLDLAQFNPIFHMNEALIQTTAGGKDFAEIASHFWFLVIFAAAVVVLGWLSYHRMLQVERQL